MAAKLLPFLWAHRPLWHLMFSGVFERHPNLHFCNTESGTKWVLDTLPELEALTHRWQTALLLEQGMPYLEIAERVPTSTATVTRVAQWLRHGAGGYRLVLDRLGKGAR